MSKKLYLVRFIRQDNGERETHYVLSRSMLEVEQAYADIISVEPIPMEEL